MKNLNSGLMISLKSTYRFFNGPAGGFRIFGLLILLVFLCIACEERFKPDIGSDYQNQLVVEGAISNLPGPYSVKLSISSEVENPQFIPLSGFTVFFVDDYGNSVYLPETSPGMYITEDSSFTGVAGRKYKIELTSPDGKSYASDFELLRQPTEIRSVSHKLEYQPDEDLPYNIAGYRFYVSSEPAAADTNYFMWQLISTYKYAADMGIYWSYEGSLRFIQDHDTLQVCYKTDTLPDIFLLNTENIQPPVITDFPLNYVTTQTRHLMYRYSLLVKQSSISKQAYNFWKIVKDQNTKLGELFSKQPFQVKGNIYNVDDPEVIVLGQFMVAGISEKRIFVDKPNPPVRMRYPVCEFHEDIYRNFVAIFEYPPESWPIFATRGPDGNALPNQWCMDCRESGGVIGKPEFWTDD